MAADPDALPDAPPEVPPGPAPPATEPAESGAPWSLRAVMQPGMAGVEMLRTASLLILALLGVMGAMFLLRRVLVPFVLAVFLSVMVSPAIDVLVHRLRWPRTLAVVVTFLAVALGLTFAVATLVPATVGLINRADQYTGHARQAVDEIITVVARILPAEEVGPTSDPDLRGATDDAAHEAGEPMSATRPADTGELSAPLEEGLERAEAVRRRTSLEQQLREAFEEQVYPGLGVFFLSFAGNLLGLASDGVLVGIFLLFLLLGRSDRPEPPGSLRVQIERGVQVYMFTMLVVSALTGLLVGLTLELLGVPMGWAFGVAAFVLNFIPNIGSIIATLLPMPIVYFSPELSVGTKVAALAIPSVIQTLKAEGPEDTPLQFTNFR